MRFLAILSLSILVCDFGYSQCNNHKLFKPGAILEMAHYDKKGKLSSTTAQKVIEVIDIPEGFQADIQSKATDDKGKELFNGDIELQCKNGAFYLSMQSMLNNDQLKNFEDMEVKIEDSMLEYPSTLSSSSSLSDGTFRAEIYSGTMKIMTMVFDIKDRKVVGNEKITVPAGTFDCYKITYTTKFKALFSFTSDVTEWYSPDIGVVKSESSKNGKSQGYSVLTKFQQ
jgi:hypothetical protein